MTEFRSDVIDELERLHAASTTGEWESTRISARVHGVYGPNWYGGGRTDAADATFIVVAHNHLPALLATLREMREALERIRDAGHENGNYCDVEMSTLSEPECDCTRGIAVDALERARERLGAK